MSKTTGPQDTKMREPTPRLMLLARLLANGGEGYGTTKAAEIAGCRAGSSAWCQWESGARKPCPRGFKAFCLDEWDKNRWLELLAMPDAEVRLRLRRLM